jgi:hypothetical protein
MEVTTAVSTTGGFRRARAQLAHGRRGISLPADVLGRSTQTGETIGARFCSSLIANQVEGTLEWGMDCCINLFEVLEALKS